MENCYKEMYFTLVRSTLSALEAMEKQNYGQAAEILIKGQQDAEDIFIEGEE